MAESEKWDIDVILQRYQFGGRLLMGLLMDAKDWSEIVYVIVSGYKKG